MTVQTHSYLTFRDNAREALEFYADVFGGSARISTFGDFGTRMAGPEYADRVMHGQVDADGGLVLMAADLPPGSDELRPGNDIGLYVGGTDAAVLRERWSALSAGGTVVIPMEEQMWGDEYGRCIDRFGITWHVNVPAGA